MLRTSASCQLHSNFTTASTTSIIPTSVTLALHPHRDQSRAAQAGLFCGRFLGSSSVQSSTAVLNPARRAWKLKSSQWPGQRERDRPSPGRDVKSSPIHITALHFSTAPRRLHSRHQTQHIIAPLRPTRPPHASRCATCCAAAEHCIRCPSTPTYPVCRCSVSASLPARHRSLPPPSLARAS